MSWVRVSVTAFFLSMVYPLIVDGVALAAGEKEDDAPTDEVIFVPPEIGAPKDRMGAGTRDVSSETTSGMLLLLVPEDGGLTTLPSPPLVWRLTHGHRGDLVVGLNPSGTDGPQFRIKGPFPAGDYGLDLGRQNFQLDTNLVYVWHVTLLDQNTGAVAERATGLIERFPESFRFNDPAANGYWFDALSEFVDISLSGRIHATKPDQFEQLMASAGVGS
ncbi:DUF928 domain-containing protein [Rhodobacteraceae bacterium B1Z28]|uniref:DUF928 domain-containing protein n=1 Tax=Ruegeria haliotis TaxID=2747601 RepID=A0ABX2PRW2_9RHOB|nr:DUF928 domain-containing protein [Ruegeria haliotis]NVO56903.1 DUF928 domain-containing protein [Ruegeria haliotis]